MDEKAERVLCAVKRKIHPYTDADIATATGLSKAVVRKRIERLRSAGLIRERWLNERGPFYELGSEE